MESKKEQVQQKVLASETGLLHQQEVQVHSGASHDDSGHRGDMSFEMRLDSFHFDELSFDAERF